MKNIIFIGMPASGKSTIGVVVAKHLGYDFIDSDLLIQKQEKRLLKDIIADVGNEGFLDLGGSYRSYTHIPHTDIQICKYTSLYTHIHSDTHKCMHICRHTYTHVCIQILAPIYTDQHTQTQHVHLHT